jgi:hypothetical protein
VDADQAFNIGSAMLFFKYFLPRKMFQVWRSNCAFNRYAKQRYNVRNRLFTWKTAYGGAMQDVQAALRHAPRACPFLEMNAARYTVVSFADAQTAARGESVKAIERAVANILQATMERVIADVTKRAHAKDDDEEEDDSPVAQKARELRNKSMAAAKEEAAVSRALRDAQAEEAMLPSNT